MRNFAYLTLPLLLGLALIPSSFAAIPSCELFYCRGFTDKPYYSTGDTGKLSIDLKNQFGYTIRLNNLSVTFPWAAYVSGQWDGNSTIPLNMNLTSNQWMPEQIVPFTVPSDGRFPASAFGGSSGEVLVHFTEYCSACGSGRYSSDAFGFIIVPNTLFLSTGWQAISNYLLYADVLLAALAVIFIIHMIWSRQKSPALPRITP